MIHNFTFAFALLVSQQGNIEIPVSGRDYMTLNNSTEIIKGTCDGREVSATILKAFRGGVGQIVLRSGRLSRQLPADFLEGRLAGSVYYAAGLGCDGHRALFRARLVRMDEAGRIGVRVQQATMDLATGALSVSEPSDMSDEQVGRELR